MVEITRTTASRARRRGDAARPLRGPPAADSRPLHVHPEWEDGCPSCSAGAHEIADGLREHLAVRDTTLAYVSRAPLAKIERYKAKKGWNFPWYLSNGSDFNYDFNVTLDRAVKPLPFDEYQGKFQPFLAL